MESLLQLTAIKQLTGLCKGSIYRAVREQRFPAPIKIAGTRRSAWRSSDVERWLAEQRPAKALKGAA